MKDGHIPPGAERIGRAVFVGAVLGGATGGLTSIMHECNMPVQPNQRPPGGYADNMQRQRYSHHYHGGRY